jgi:hypothetical protein
MLWSTCECQYASFQSWSLQSIINIKKPTNLLKISKKQNHQHSFKKIMKKQRTHTCMTLFASILMLCIMQHINMSTKIVSNNNQYPWNWFKTSNDHWNQNAIDLLCHNPFIKTWNFTLQGNYLPWITKIDGLLNSKVYLNWITLDANRVFTKVFQLWRVNKGLLQALAHYSIPFLFFYSSNNLTKRRLCILDGKFSHYAINFDIISTILTTFGHDMPITSSKIQLCYH